jgi:hypothetical protein
MDVQWYLLMALAFIFQWLMKLNLVLCTYVFTKVSAQAFCPSFHCFIFILLSFESLLYTLNISPSSHIWFANTFFQLVTYLFILTVIFFSEQKFYISMKPDLFSFFSYDLYFCLAYLRILQLTQVMRAFCCFLLVSFIVLHFTFRSMIHLELKLVQGTTFSLKIIYLHMDEWPTVATLFWNLSLLISQQIHLYFENSDLI